MTFFADPAGNFYTGDVKFANINPSTPKENILYSTVDESNFLTDLETMVTASSLQVRSVNNNDNALDGLALNQGIGVIIFSSSTDTTDGRFFIQYANVDSGGTNRRNAPISIYNESGTTLTDAATSYNISSVTNNRIGASTAGSSDVPDFTTINYSYEGFNYDDRGRYTPIYGCSGTNGDFLYLFRWQKNYTTGKINTSLLFAGEFEGLNTNENYYTNPTFPHRKFLYGVGHDFYGSFNDPIIKINHTMIDTGKQTHLGNFGEYLINCSDATPYSEDLSTYFHVLEENSILGYPAIGRSPMMLMSYGVNLKIGDMVEINGGMPDNGSPYYVVASTYGTRKILLRVYSSI